MKLNITIDCSPEEARRFLGMPDVSEVQEKMTKAMMDNMANIDAETLMKYWMPQGENGLNQMADHMSQWQNMFFNAMQEKAKE